MTSLYLFDVSNNIHDLYICFTKIMNEIERICKPPTIKIQYRVRFVCLMFFVPLKNFSFKHHGDVVTIIDKGPQILTYTRHLLPSSRATPIVTRVTHLYILEDRCHSHPSRAFGSGVVTTRLTWPGFEHPTFTMQSERSNQLRHRRSYRV